MKTLLFLAMLFASGVARADILANGDFKEGTAHWDGDGRTPSDNGTIDLGSNAQATPQGLIIQLDPSKWKYISQTFSSKDSPLQCSFTYQLSHGCTFPGDANADVTQVLTPADLLRMTGKAGNSIGLKYGSVLLVVLDPEAHLNTHYKIKLVLDSTDAQTVTNVFPQVSPNTDKAVYLFFPPGNGTITLLHMAMTPSAP